MAKTLDEMGEEKKKKYLSAMGFLTAYHPETIGRMTELLKTYLKPVEGKETFKYEKVDKETHPDIFAAFEGTTNTSGRPWDGLWGDAGIALQMNKEFDGLDCKEHWVEAVRDRIHGRLTAGQNGGIGGHKKRVKAVEDHLEALQKRVDELSTLVNKLDARMFQAEAILTDPTRTIVKPQKVLPFAYNTNGSTTGSPEKV